MADNRILYSGSNWNRVPEVSHQTSTCLFVEMSYRLMFVLHVHYCQLPGNIVVHMIELSMTADPYWYEVE